MIDEMSESVLDLVVAGTGDAVMMVESEAKELPEMMYQWRSPFRLDDAQFRARFGAAPTAIAPAVAATIEWVRARYGAAQPGGAGAAAA